MQNVTTYVYSGGIKLRRCVVLTSGKKYQPPMAMLKMNQQEKKSKGKDVTIFGKIQTIPLEKH